MTEREFKRRIAELLVAYRRRMLRLKAIAKGDVRAKQVKVKGHWVRRHRVDEHTRFL